MVPNRIGGRTGLNDAFAATGHSHSRALAVREIHESLHCMCSFFLSLLHTHSSCWQHPQSCFPLLLNCSQDGQSLRQKEKAANSLLHPLQLPQRYPIPRDTLSGLFTIPRLVFQIMHISANGIIFFLFPSPLFYQWISGRSAAALA